VNLSGANLHRADFKWRLGTASKINSGTEMLVGEPRLIENSKIEPNWVLIPKRGFDISVPTIILAFMFEISFLTPSLIHLMTHW
jgi:hypothetical protein